MGSVSGLKANAAKFVSTNQQTLSISDNASISAGNIDLTLAAHVYLNNATTTYYIIDKSNNGSSMEYRLSYTSGKLRFRFGTGLLDSPSVSANAWHTVVAWYDSGNDTINLQVDNGTVTSASYANGAPDTTYPLLFGDSLTSAAPFDGRVDEVAIYKRVLTVQERSWLHNGGVGRTYAELDSTSSLVDYTYDLNHVHAVKTVGTSDSYTYDANGNMTCRVEAGVTYKQDYNVENQLITVSKMDGDCVTGTILETTSFTYDGDGNLVKTTKRDNSKTIYVGGVYEEDKTGTTVTHTRTYYPAGGAMRIDGTLYYVLKDHLGSASVITDESGNPLTNGEQRYYPFGESRITGANMLTDKLYTGQRDTGLGIYYYNARFYSPYINHFIQPDTIIPNQGNPQSWNRYSYVSNNPLRYTDPSGHRACEDYGGSCVSENQMTRIVQTKIARLHERQNRYYRNDTPKDDAVTTTAYSNYTATATLPSFATVTSAPTSTSMTTYLTTPLATNVPYVVGAAPTVTPTGMPAPTSEFWAITRDKHSPGGEFIPDTTVPFGANYDLWSVVDAAAKYLGPLAGYPAMTKNITDFWTGKAAVPIINAAADFIVSRGAGAFYIPNNSLISPPPVQQ